MPIQNKKKELARLIEYFEAEAKKFHDLKMSTFFVTQDGATEDRKFDSSNHTIMLWQYYGTSKENGDTEQLLENIKTSDIQWGIRGAILSHFAVIEGEKCNLFVRMAKRAADIFSKKEKEIIKARIVSEIIDSKKSPYCKSIATTNNNQLAIWLNYLLYYMSLVNPDNKNSSRIEIDPFSLSLFALEQLQEDLEIRVQNKNDRKIENLKFKVALSFPGEKRDYAKKVSEILSKELGEHKVFYDNFYQSQLARPNLDILLQNIYRNQSELIVIFLCKEYAQKEWCGLEWRAIRDIIKSKQDDQLMFVRFDDAPIDGVFSIDGYIDANNTLEEELSNLVIERIKINEIKR